MFGGRGFNPSWIEEGTAEIAGEKSSRDATGLGDGVEAGYATLYPGGARTIATYGMTVVQSRARTFLAASPISALVGNPDPNPNKSTYYGASWLFHRFVADAYGGADEDGFFRALNTGGAGVSQLEAVAGRPMQELLAEYARAIGLEGQPAARAVAPVRFRSYDFADIAGPLSEQAWPYVQASSGFTSGRWLFPEVHHTSPLFLDFSTAGGSSVRLDAHDGAGADLTPEEDVVLVVTRIR